MMMYHHYIIIIIIFTYEQAFVYFLDLFCYFQLHVLDTKDVGMAPSAGGLVPEHCLPYATELGPSVTLDALQHQVSQQNMRPSIPKRWELETRVGHTIQGS